MPYCKFCGKKLEDNENCSCPDALKEAGIVTENEISDAVEAAPDVSEAPEDTADTGEELSEKAEAVMDKAKDKVSGAEDSVSEVLDSARKSISDLGNELHITKDAPKAAAPDYRTFRKGMTIICILLVLLVLLLALIISMLGGSYRKAVNDLVRGVNTCNSELVLRSVFPADYLDAVKEDVSDEDEDWDYIIDDFNEVIESIQESAEDEYFGRSPKLSIKITERDKVSSRTRKKIAEHFDDLDCDISRMYKLKTEITVRGKDASESAKVNLYAVKPKGGRWVVYADEKAAERIEDIPAAYQDEMSGSIEEIMSDYEETFEWFQ